MKYKVKEIFGPTIQGEGYWSGSAVVFLRLTGCNKWSGRAEDKASSICSFCDTDFVGGDSLTADQIVEKLKALSEDVRHLVISGGEPLLQLDRALCIALRKEGFYISIETNGSKPLGELNGLIDHVTMSPKQPPKETKLEYCDDLKILYPFISPQITLESFGDFKHTRAYLQPIDDPDKSLNTFRAIQAIYKNSKVLLGVQLHKILEVK